MKILVTGANGFLGSHVVDRLLENGHEVNALIRPSSPSPSWDARVKIFRADLRVAGNLSDALRDVDVVIHLAAMTSGNEDVQFASTVVGTENLLAAMFKSRVRRIVHVSSLVVYDWSQAKGILDENTPLESDIYSMGGYAIAKYWQERLIWRYSQCAGCELIILRPGFIWGRDHAVIAGMGRRLGKFHLVIGPTASLPLTHVENCADCIVFATESPKAIGEAFNVIDSESISAWRYVGEYISHSKGRGIRVAIPYRLGATLAAIASRLSCLLFGKNGKLPSIMTPRRYECQFKPLRFSTGKLQNAMNWSSPFDFHACVKKTYNHRQADPSMNK